MMQRSIPGSIATTLMLLLLATGCSQQAGTRAGAADDQDPDAGFTTIFDGRSFGDWEIIYENTTDKPKPDAFFLEDGALACKGYGFHWFRYKRPVKDFILRLEFKTARETNSGICLRSLDIDKGAPPFTGFEVQIVDDFGHDPNKHSTGAIYDVVTPMYNASRPPGEWNEMEIACLGSYVRVRLNGTVVVSTDFAKLTEPIGKFDFPYANMPSSGYIALQDHWTPIWYRNIRLLEGTFAETPQ